MEASQRHLSRVRVGAQKSAAKTVASGKSASLGDPTLSSASRSEVDEGEVGGAEVVEAEVDDLEEGQEEEEASRMCCDRCQKWRALPKSMQAEVEAEALWVCTMSRGIT